MTQADPLWVRVRRDLETRLLRGEFDERFPTDRELTEEYDVSRHTIREAVRGLQEEGLITRHRGAGSFRAPRSFHQPVGSIYSLFRSIEEAGVDQTSIVVEQRKVVDADAAKILDLEADAPLFHLERIRLAGGRPLAVDSVHIPWDIAAPLMDADFTHTALYDELAERCGVIPARGSEDVAPVGLDRHTADRLGLDPGDAAFAIDRRTFTADDRPLEWRTTVLNGQLMSFRSEWTRPWVGDSAVEPEWTPGV